MGKHKHCWLNTHHIIWQSQSERARINDETNKKLVSILDHQALNSIVWDKQHPQAQMEVMNKKFWWTSVMSEYSKTLFNTLVSMPRAEFYDPVFIRK